MPGLKNREEYEKSGGQIGRVSKQGTVQKAFTVGDLSLRDCWKIVKSGLRYWITLGIIYGVGFIISYVGIWGYKAGSDAVGFEPVGKIWSSIPIWSKYMLVLAIALLVLRELTVNLLIAVGNMLKGFGQDIEKASFKGRLITLIIMSFFIILVIYAPLALFALGMTTWALIAGYEDLKREKLEQMQDEEA